MAKKVVYIFDNLKENNETSSGNNFLAEGIVYLADSICYL